MVFFNWATMQMAAKIVYYGPGLCGKTSNLSYIYAKTTPNSRGEMVSLETESDRTLFFDLLPIEVGTIGGFKTRLQLYTVPGQVFYNTTRKLVLKGVDGLVFVADSQRPMREANIESFGSLVDNLEDLGLEMADLPLVLQYNKRDLKNILTVDELNTDLNPQGRYTYHESSAINGDGVFETLKEITKLTLKKLRKRMASSQPGGGATAASEPVRPAMAPQRPESISAAALARAAEEGVVAHTPGAPAAPMPATPTTVAPPRAASKPATPIEPPAPPEPPVVDEAPSGESDVFTTPPETTADELPAGGPLDGIDQPAETVELGSMEVTAPEVVEAAAQVEVDEAVDAEIEQPELADGDDWRDRATEVSELAGETEVSGEVDEADPTDNVDFEQQPAAEAAAEPPPMKRVHVSNQLDILAELEGLRVGSTSGGTAGSRRAASPEIDIDSLISGAVGGSKEIRRRVEQRLDATAFGKMRGLELAIRIKDADGEVVHTLEPVLTEVDGAGDLSKISLRFVIDLENNG